MKYNESAKRLREAMQAKNMSQQDLADASGVTKSSISHYVNGKNIPDNFQAYKLSLVLDVPPEWLMGFDSEPEYIVVKGENLELIRTIEKLGPEEKQQVMAYVSSLLKKEKKDE